MTAAADTVTPPSLATGDRIDVTDVDAGVCIVSRVEDVTGNRAILRLTAPTGPSSKTFNLRRIAAGTEWRAEVDASHTAHPLSLEIVLPVSWEQADARKSQRVDAGRRPVALRLPDGRRRDLVGIDVSASGLLASGQGEAPPPGSLVMVSPDTGSYEQSRRWIPAVVAGVQRMAFGRFEAGLRFAPETDEQRRTALGWRDEIAGRTSEMTPSTPLPDDRAA